MKKQSESKREVRQELALQNRAGWQEAYEGFSPGEKIVLALALGVWLDGREEAGPDPDASTVSYFNPAVSMRALEEMELEQLSEEGRENAEAAWQKLGLFFEERGLEVEGWEGFSKPLEKLYSLGGYVEKNNRFLTEKQLRRVGRELKTLARQLERGSSQEVSR